MQALTQMNRRTLWLVVALAGGGAALVGSALGMLVLVLGLTTGGALNLDSTLPGGALISLALGLGIPVACQGWAGWKGKPARPFTPRAVWWMALALVVSLSLGALVTRLPVLPRILLPPIHAVAMALPPLILLWLTGRALRGSGGSWREVVASLGGGGLLGTALSFAAEVALLFALAAVAALVLLAIPGVWVACRRGRPAWIALSVAVTASLIAVAFYSSFHGAGPGSVQFGSLHYFKAWWPLWGILAACTIGWVARWRPGGDGRSGTTTSP